MNVVPRRLGLVGCGRIGAPVLAAWEAGGLPGWEITSVLVRDAGPSRGARYTDDLSVFLGTRPTLVLEVAGPGVLSAIAEPVLRIADLWTTSGVALADAALMQRVQDAGRTSGHRLRVLPGAFAGLDGVAASAVAPNARLRLDIDLPPGPAPAAHRFSGTAREAACRFPDSVNVAVAAAIAGPGLDETHVDVRHPGPVPRHRLALRADSDAGSLEVAVEPRLAPGVHPVACSAIAALRRETQVVWVG